MQILSISLKNIKCHLDRKLHFVKGINVLSGANGVGKSTIFEAIGYAMFGVDARDFVGNTERFISIGAKRGEISVTFSTDDGETYQVSRSVGAGSKWLLARGIGGVFEVEDHAGIHETEARLKKLLGLDSGRPLADQFKLVIGPFQNEFLGPFVLKQPTRRQEAFDEILGIDAWRKTYKGTSTLLALVKSKIEILAAEIEGRQEQVAILPEREKEWTDLATRMEARQKVLATKEKALAEEEERLARLDSQERAANAIQSKIQVLDSRIRDGEMKILDQQQRVTEAEHASELLVKSRAGKEAYEAAETALKYLRQKEQRRREIEKDISAFEKESARLAQFLEHELREVENTEKQLAVDERQLTATKKALVADQDLTATAALLPKVRQEIEQLRTALGLLAGQRSGLQEGKEKLAEGNCPFFSEPCRNIASRAGRDVFSARVMELDAERVELGRRLDELGQESLKAEKARHELESMAGRTREIEKQIKALENRRQENYRRRQGLVAISKQQQEVDQQAVTRKEGLKVFLNLDDEIAGVEKVRADNQQTRDQFFANQNNAQDLNNRRENLKKMRELLDELKQSLVAGQKELELLQKDYDPKRHGSIRLAKEKLVADCATLREQIQGIDKDRLRLETEISKLKQIRKEIEARLAAKKIIEDKESLVKFLRNQIFNNVSAQLSERFREEVSLRANSIYRSIAEADEELYWGDKYQIVLRDMQDGEYRERTDDQLSGGQTMSAVVALRLALLQTIGARIAFFDEPTSNLDAARRDNLAQAFRALDTACEEGAEHWYDQLFLISHDLAFTEVTDQIISL